MVCSTASAARCSRRFVGSRPKLPFEPSTNRLDSNALFGDQSAAAGLERVLESSEGVRDGDSSFTAVSEFVGREPGRTVKAE
jgi:hypothetical protein